MDVIGPLVWNNLMLLLGTLSPKFQISPFSSPAKNFFPISSINSIDLTLLEFRLNSLVIAILGIFKMVILPVSVPMAILPKFPVAFLIPSITLTFEVSLVVDLSPLLDFHVIVLSE